MFSPVSSGKNVFQERNKENNSRMKLIDTIPLANGLNMEIWDATRAIAADTVRVELIIRVEVEIKPDYFQDAAQYDACRGCLGDRVVFEHLKERSFVPMALGSTVLKELLAEFKQNSFEYIARPNFPARFVLSKYTDFKNNPCKYQHH